MQDGTLLAAVDLGSNSFRLEIGRFAHGQIRRIEYLKETVRQGAELDSERNLSPQAMQRGWDCLARFAERLASFAPGQVRAVATQTLREARNRESFLIPGSTLLGHPIDVISGPEEARLIYQGVSHLLPHSPERRLVVDIGGRSTELILGQQYQAHAVTSLRVGSVSCSNAHFADGLLSAQAFDLAETAAKAVLDEAISDFAPSHWDIAYGSSGTVGAVGDILTLMGGPSGVIERQGLDVLRERLLRAGHIHRLQLDGLKEERRPVIGGGLAVLRAVFDLLDIEQMQVAQGALRQGVLYDLLNREWPETDIRCTTVTAMMRRFGVDMAQAQRVAHVAQCLFTQVAPNHTEAGRDLSWAAQLHEIGYCIAHSGYHRHGAYILDNADTSGFSVSELHQLGLLIRAHRGKLRKLELAWNHTDFMLQLACLRVAVALCHARRDPDLQGLELSYKNNRLSLRTRIGWSQAYPQSAHLLREESTDWQRTPWELAVQLD